MAREFFINRLLEIQQSNFEVIEMHKVGDVITFELKHKPHAVYECSICEAKQQAAYDFRWIVLRDVPVGPIQVRWKVLRARIQCHCSGGPRVENLFFRSKNHHLTKRFQFYLEDVLCTKMFTVKDVSRLFHLDYGLVYKVDHEVLIELAQKMEIPDVLAIAVDEKSFEKGHRYVTVVSDIDRGKAIWVSSGNRKESLDEFFKIMGPDRCAKIRVVCRDGHDGYGQSIKEHIPHAVEVMDKFHVFQRIHQALDECRKELMGGAGVFHGDSRLRGAHWVIRHRQENLKSKHNVTLEKLRELNMPLYEAYLMKEKFFELFDFPHFEIKEAEEFLRSWVYEVAQIGLEGMNKFIGYLRGHWQMILNIIRTRMTSSVAEGLNRKIQVLKGMAYGYRNIHYFKLKILQRCGILGDLIKLRTC
jgi:transposase